MEDSSCFSAKDDFLSTLEEVRALLKLAASNEREVTVYATLVKASLIFLASKLEAFLEDIVAEFIDKINEQRPHVSRIPYSVKISALDCILDEGMLSKIRGHDPSAGEIFSKVAILCGIDSVVEELRIRVKFNYGKHGEDEIIKLFAQIGIDDVFEACPLVSSGESTMIEEQVHQKIDVRADINSVTNIRNNILHTDATPSLTHYQVAEFVKHFILFAEKLVEVLNCRFLQIILSSTGVPN